MYMHAAFSITIVKKTMAWPVWRGGSKAEDGTKAVTRARKTRVQVNRVNIAVGQSTVESCQLLMKAKRVDYVWIHLSRPRLGSQTLGRLWDPEKRIALRARVSHFDATSYEKVTYV